MLNSDSPLRLAALLDQQPAVVANGVQPLATANDVPPRITVSALTAAWSGISAQVGPLDLQIPPGTRLAITGPNGCGKSTLLAVLARALDPADGRYQVLSSSA